MAAESALARGPDAVQHLAAAALKVGATQFAAPNDQSLPPQSPGPPSQPPVPVVESGDAVAVQAAGPMAAEGEAAVCAEAHRLPLGPGVAVEAQTPP